MKYDGYDLKCIIYLSCIILKELEKTNDFIYIDAYYDEILKIYEDYKKVDNYNKSLLDSIDDFLNNNMEAIKSRLDNVFSERF